MADRTRPPADQYRASATTEDKDGALETTGAYETGDSVVLYDTERPLAWIESDSAVTLEEMR